MRRSSWIIISIICLLMVYTDLSWAHGTQENDSDFVKLISGVFSPENSPLYIAIIFIFSFFLGAVHALTPGHGKTIVSAYMLGTRGTVKDAVTLGITVTITHMFSVIILGIILAVTSRYVMPEKLTGILGAVSGVIILAIGIGMLLNRLKNKGRHHPHEHGHDHPDGHTHDDHHL
ncbi:MAG: hypothetical protein JRH15_23695, partial [Deltaproteobacteria bacterium]|nr:hypothetical protein [Deltaproteobacteria bacterium]